MNCNGNVLNSNYCESFSRGTWGLFSCNRFGEEGQKISCYYTVEPNKDWVQENPEVDSVVEWGKKRSRKLDIHFIPSKNINMFYQRFIFHNSWRKLRDKTFKGLCFQKFSLARSFLLQYLVILVILCFFGTLLVNTELLLVINHKIPKPYNIKQ